VSININNKNDSNRVGKGEYVPQWLQLIAQQGGLR